MVEMTPEHLEAQVAYPILPGWLSGLNVQLLKEVCVEIHIACCICWFMFLMNHQFLNDFR